MNIMPKWLPTPQTSPENGRKKKLFALMLMIAAGTSIGACAASIEYTLMKADPKSKITFTSPAYSPDGKRLAYVRRTDFKPGDHFTNKGESLYIAEFKAGHWVHRLVSANADSPVWSPSGKSLAFDRGGLALLDLGSGRIRQLTHSRYPKSSGKDEVRAHYDKPLSFSPDGRFLAYERQLWESTETRIFDLKLRRDSAFKHWGVFDWSADGRHTLLSWRWFMDDSRVPTRVVMQNAGDSGWRTVLKNYRVADVNWPKEGRNAWVVIESPLPEGPKTDLAPPQGPGLYNLDLQTRKLRKLADIRGWIIPSRDYTKFAYIKDGSASGLYIGETSKWTMTRYAADVLSSPNWSEKAQSFCWSPSGKSFAYVTGNGDIQIAQP